MVAAVVLPVVVEVVEVAVEAVVVMVGALAAAIPCQSQLIIISCTSNYHYQQVLNNTKHLSYYINNSYLN